MSKKKYTKTMNLGSIFDFGQYKGHMVKDVIENDSGYISWCLREIEWFTLGVAARKYYESMVDWEEDEKYDWDDIYT